MPIDWGDRTTWADVRAATAVPPDPGLVWAWEPGFDWSRFWLSPDPFNLGGGAAAAPPKASPYVWFWEPGFDWGKAADDAIWYGVPNEAERRAKRYMENPGQALAEDIGLVGPPGSGATAAAAAAWLPWAVVGGGVLLIFSVVKAR